MSESRPNLPRARAQDEGKGSARSLASRSSAALRSALPTVSSITARVSGSISRIFNFNQQKLEARRQKLFESTTVNVNSISELVSDQHDTLREIIEIVKRIKLECDDEDQDGKRGRRGRGRGRTGKGNRRDRKGARVRPPAGRTPIPDTGTKPSRKDSKPARPPQSVPDTRPAPSATDKRPSVPETRPAPRPSAPPVPAPPVPAPPVPAPPVPAPPAPPVPAPPAPPAPPPPPATPQQRPEAGAGGITRPSARDASRAGRSGAVYSGVGAAGTGEGGAGIAEAARQGASVSAQTSVISQAAEVVIRDAAKRYLARAISTKIPIAGMLASLWFAGERVAAGDWVGAGLEISAGAAGTLGAVTYGLGTAASVAIDIVQLTRDVYNALYGIFPEDETDPSLREARLGEIRLNLTNALMSIIQDAPEPTRPQANNETRNRVLQIIAADEANRDLQELIGPDVLVGITRLLAQTTDSNITGNTPMQRAARRGLEDFLNRVQPLIASRAPAAERVRIEEAPRPEEQTPAAVPGTEEEEIPASLRSYLSPASNAVRLEADQPAPASQTLIKDDESTEAPNPYALPTGDAVDALSGEVKEPVSGPMTQNVEGLLKALSDIQFNEIMFEAMEIEFDGDVELGSGSDLTTRISTGTARISGLGAQTDIVAGLIGTLGAAVGIDVPERITKTDIFGGITGGAGGTGAPDLSSFMGTPGAAAVIPEGEAAPEAPAAPAPSVGAPTTPAAPAPGAPEGQPTGGDFMSEVNRVSSRFGLNPSDLLAVMRSESSLNPRAVNPTTGASGLIQFMPRTAASLGTSVEAIRQMSAVEQMRYVERYFQSVGVQPGSSAGRLYAYVFLPGRAGREVLTQAGENFYEANRGLDMDRDGRITIADLDARLARFGGSATAQLQPAAPAGGTMMAQQSAEQNFLDRDRARLALMEENRAGSQRGRLGQKENSGSVIPGRPGTTASREVPLVNRLQKAAG